MATPSSGAISLYHVLVEQGLSGTISLNDAVCRNYAGAPSGQISMSQLRGKSKLGIGATTSGTGVGGHTYNLTLSGVSAVSSHGWVSGGGGIIVQQQSATAFRFTTNRTGYSSGTYRFTVTRGTESISKDVYLYISGPGGGGRSCFVAGSLVRMADFSLRAIEDVAVGDWVRTAVGISRVYELYRPVLGERALYRMAVDGKCVTSGEHSLWTRSPVTGEQWWSTRDMQQWLIEAATGDGPWFGGHLPFDLTHREGEVWGFAHERGWVDTAWERVPAGPKTQLYHLHLEQGGSYFVDGYLVSSVADTGGVDWESFRWA